MDADFCGYLNQKKCFENGSDAAPTVVASSGVSADNPFGQNVAYLVFLPSFRRTENGGL